MSSLKPVAPKQSLNVWLEENETSSDGTVFETEIHNLQDLLNLYGKFAHVDGQKPLQGIFKWEPFAPEKPNVTQDPFDQGQLYYALDDLCRYMESLGFDVQKILGNRHSKVPHPMVAYANKVSDLNAWYSPQEDALTFGMDDGKWHLSSDSDVDIHEGGHLLLDHFHPGFGGSFGGNEGGAIHEGYGDATASLRYDDPEMSEDFAKALGRPPSKTDGLRKVNQNLTLGEVGTEVHDRGQVYAGFFWSLREKLGQDQTFKILGNHAANYRTSKPKPPDFVEAVLKGISALDRAGGLDSPREQVESLVREKALRRQILAKPTLPPNDPPYLGVQHALKTAVKTFGGEGVVRFRKISEAPYIGGVQEKYQQTYQSKNFGELSVLDCGILINKNPDKTVDASFRDALSLQAGGVDETLRVSLSQALQKVEGLLKREKVRLDQETLLLKKEETAVRKLQLKYAASAALPTEVLQQMTAYVRHRQEVDAGNRILQRSLEVLQTGRPQTQLVVDPKGKELLYEFRLGYARAYVWASTETVLYHPEFFY